MTLVAWRSCRCTRPRPGNDHAGTEIGWPRSEPVLGEADQEAICEGVPHPRGDVEHVGVGLLGAFRSDGDDRCHNEINRDDVDDALGDTGELPKQSAGVGDDDRLGHPEAADPPGPRFGQCRLDDRRPDDAERDRVGAVGSVL